MTPEGLVIESLFMIPDKEGNDVPFILNSTQKKIDETLTGRDYYPKARQEGVSMYHVARRLVKCLSKRNTRAVVISHDKESTQRMFTRVTYFLDNIRGPKAVIGHESKNELTFPKTDSMFYIGTAGARKFGRGDTITDLHCSEAAFWPDPKSLTAGLFQAVPRGGEIAIESTGNGVGNWYHKMVMRAAGGGGRYRNHFFDWQSFDEYKKELNDDERKHVVSTLDPKLDEVTLHERGLLTLEQIAWRREKLEEMDYDLRLFKQEYPMTLDECFQATGSSLFYKVKYVPTEKWQLSTTDMYLLEGHPDKYLHYVIGVDVGGGVEQDSSVGCVICLETMEQAAEYTTNRLAPDIFTEHLAELGHLFNDAYMVIESNNHGIVVMKELRDMKPPYPAYLIYNDPSFGTQAALIRRGHRTTTANKFGLVGLLRKMLATELTIHSDLLNNELSTYVENEDGTLGAEKSCFDDRVVAAAQACFGIPIASMLLIPIPQVVKELPLPFSLEAIKEELSGRGNSFPIKPQHRLLT